MHVPFELCRPILSLLPPGKAPRIRTLLIRAGGFDVARSATFMDRPSVIGPPPAHRRLHIGRDVFINADCIFDLGADITIGDRVYLAHRVMLITSTHEISGEHQRAGEMVTSPITIGAGSWLGAGSMVLPGVTVGRGSVVAAGAVVTRDVAPCSLVAGTPARLLRRLPAAGTPPAPPVQLATARSPVAGSDHDGTCGS